MGNNKNFGVRKTTFLPITLTIFACVITFTLAFFFTSDWATSHLQMSGKVQITAVGKGDLYNSIENDVNSSNLVIEYDRDYGVLIPGEPIRLDANCKVGRSTTMPLLRAKLVLELKNVDTDTPYDETQINVIANLNDQLDDIILDSASWYLHTDGFYYLVLTKNDSAPENSILKEINATESDVIINFINKEITFPTFVTSDYSGLSVRFKITFQAIQNYIPDDNGDQIPNTIKNSLKIFDTFTE